jgi:hypothetical protein
LAAVLLAAFFVVTALGFFLVFIMILASASFDSAVLS